MPPRRRAPDHPGEPRALAAALLLLVSLGGCGSRQDARATAQPSNAAAAPASAGGSPAATMPPATRPWSSADFGAAAQALATRAAQAPTTLPRIDDPQTSPLFAHMMARTNLGHLQTPAILVQQRVQESMRIHGSLAEWLRAYLVPLNQGLGYQREVVEIIGLTLVSSEIALALLAEFLSSLPPEEAQHPDRQAGFAQVLRGLHQTVVGVVSSFLPPDREIYGVGPLLRLVELVTPTLPRLVAALPPESHQQVAELFAAAIEREADPGLRQALVRLRDAVAAAQPAPPGTV